VDRAQDAVSFLENQHAFVCRLKANTTSSGVRSALEEVKKVIDLKMAGDYTLCVEVAMNTFNGNFDHNIRDLLSLFPPDHLDSQGQPFWSGPKRAPSPITFNPEEPTHL
jgi:ubiquitin-activating enzyme E1